MDRKNCHVAIEIKEHGSNASSNQRESLLRIKGMGCQNCANRVHNSILKQYGVYDVLVDLEMRSAQIHYDADKVTIDQLISAVNAAGNDGRHNYSAALIAYLTI